MRAILWGLLMVCCLGGSLATMAGEIRREHEEPEDNELIAVTPE
jgi:hypothetical protein